MDDAGMREAKRSIRREARARVAALTPDERVSAADDACRAAAGARAFHDAESVLLYLSLPDEIETEPLLVRALGAGKRVFLPRMDWEHDSMDAVEILSPDFPTQIRRHGVVEPVGGDVIEPSSLDLIIVPGVAFDRKGGRIGRGKGFYDRYLTRAGGGVGTSGGPFRIGLCFACQVVDSVPHDDHDERVHALACEAGLTVC